MAGYGQFGLTDLAKGQMNPQDDFLNLFQLQGSRQDKDLMTSQANQFLYGQAQTQQQQQQQQTQQGLGFQPQGLPRGMPTPQQQQQQQPQFQSRGNPPGSIPASSASITMPTSLTQQSASSPNRNLTPSNNFGLRMQNFPMHQATLLGVFAQSHNASGNLNDGGLDLSEFPALANRGRQTNDINNMSSFPTNPMAGRPQYVGMVNKQPEQTTEFQMQEVDFPALPGANKSTDQFQLDLGVKDGPKFPGENNNGNNNENNGNSRRGIQISPDGKISNIPPGMLTDPFGMVGLLTFLQAIEAHPNMVQLALGSDLTTLGLNLNSPENLYSTFQSPWADAPSRPQDIDFHVPQEYLTNTHIKDKLAPIKLNRYGEDLLFYLYYTHGGDVLQLAAAAELYNRDWRYHKDERVWITRGPGMEPQIKTSTYERGVYYYFDCSRWIKVAKEFHLDYEKLEERPHLPASVNHNVSMTPIPR